MADDRSPNEDRTGQKGGRGRAEGCYVTGDRPAGSHNRCAFGRPLEDLLLRPVNANAGESDISLSKEDLEVVAGSVWKVHTKV
ncbi:hypothetical protein N7530_001902 [Penicillium desertorum]|uniref:Uncharacterized protein n=1 Tax=Penicillium desertorum TaxID=1303715 RepID=A0A9W9XB02_9EURO|nr:hypothetical protein N7530_001902 [Penicillium desertorum]